MYSIAITLLVEFFNDNKKILIGAWAGLTNKGVKLSVRGEELRGKKHAFFLDVLNDHDRSLIIITNHDKVNIRNKSPDNVMTYM